MKNRILTGTVLTIAGALISIGPQTLFKVCDTSKMISKCYWSARAEIGIGLILIVGGILYLLLEHWRAGFAISFLSFTTGIVAIFIPAYLIGGCADKMMPCQSRAFPAIYLISAITILYSIGNSIYLYKRSIKEIRENADE